MNMRTRKRLNTAGVSTLLLFAWGCQGCSKPAKMSEPPADLAASQEISSNLSRIINEARIKYAPLRYEYAEDLLERLDRIEADFAGKTEAPPPRYLPTMDEKEEKAHFRETVRRWEAATGKKLRTEVDRLKASVAARKPGELFHPVFQKDFSSTFDDFIKIEVLETREHCNRVIHEAAESVFAKNRERYPLLVRQFEEELKKPEFAIPDAAR